MHPPSGICDRWVGYHSGSGLGGIRIIRATLIDSRAARGIAVGLAGLIAAAVFAYWPAWVPLWHLHGFFVAALALLLVYSSRNRWITAPVRPIPLALLLVGGLGIAALWVGRDSQPALQVLLLPSIVMTAILAAFGTSVARALLVPVAFLLFAAPLWNLLLTPPLQALTVRVTAMLAPLLGMPASISGDVISFSNGVTFVVTEACSGANFLIQGLAVATLLGELEQAGAQRRLALLAAMIPTALLANWVRVLLIIELGYATNMRSSLATSNHVTFGFAIFFVALAVYVWLATRKPLPEAEPARAGTPDAWHPQLPYFGAVAVMAFSALGFQALIPASGPAAG
ncbi:MAG: exosortase [Proteobacteria bacterium]|nr:exosortase [Pseudomonadota bacterium]